MEQPENDVVLCGQLLKRAELRTTPAGVPIARFLLAHRSRREEAGQLRDVECRVFVVASGEHLTKGLARLVPGDRLRVRGFISRAGYRAPDGRLELHALDIQAASSGGH